MSGYHRGDSRGRYRGSRGKTYNSTKPYYKRPTQDRNQTYNLKTEEDPVGQNKLIRPFKDLGETTNLNANLAYVTTQVIKEWQINQNDVLTVFTICITQLPFKLVYYAQLLSQINKENTQIAQDILSHLVRFFGFLVNSHAITALSLFQVYNQLLSQLQSENQNPSKKLDLMMDQNVYIVLASLPFIGKILFEQAQKDLKQLLATIETYMNNRKAYPDGSDEMHIESDSHSNSLSIEILNNYRDGNQGFDKVDVLTELWLTILKLQSNNWEVDVLFKPHKIYMDNITQPKLNLRNLATVPDFPDFTYAYQGPVFHIYTSDTESKLNIKHHLPDIHHISRFIMSDSAREIIHLFSHNHKECIRYLLSLSKFHLVLDTDEDGKAAVFEIILETIFTEMLKFPKSKEKTIYYMVLVAGLCKGAPTLFPSALGKAVKILFLRLDDQEYPAGGMDVASIKTEYALSLSPSTGRHSFLCQLMDSCVRLSYIDHIKVKLPQSFVDSNVFDKEGPRVNFKFADKETTGNEEFHSLMQDLEYTLKSSMRESVLKNLEENFILIRNFLNLNPEFKCKFYFQDIDSILLECLIQCLMISGSKSFSHLLNSFERNLPALKAYMSTTNSSQSSEKTIKSIHIISEFWKYNTQAFELSLNKLQNYLILDPQSVLLWVLKKVSFDLKFGGCQTLFEESNTAGGDFWGGEECFYQSLYWNLLFSTLAKVNLRCDQCFIKLEECKKSEDMSKFSDLSRNYEGASRDRKVAFQFVLAKFCEIISQKSSIMESSGVDIKLTDWWRWVVGNMREVLRRFDSTIKTFKVTLDINVFSDNKDPKVLKIWSEACEMYERRVEFKNSMIKEIKPNLTCLSTPITRESVSYHINCENYNKEIVDLNFSDFIQDQFYFVSACMGGTASLRSKDGDWIGSYIGHRSSVLSSKISRDAVFSVTGSLDCTTKVWQNNSGEMLLSFDNYAAVKIVDISFDNKFVLTSGSENKIKIYDLGSQRKKPLRILDFGISGEIKSVLFDSENGLILNIDGKELKLWDLKSSKIISKVKFDNNLTNLKFSQDKDYIMLSELKKLHFFKLKSAELVKTFTFDFIIQSYDYKEKLRKLIVSFENLFEVFVYDWEENEIDIKIGHCGKINAVSFTPDDRFASASNDKTIKIWV
ncbi:Nuclear cap-binding protein subunit 1 [Clydaea vesicula]|uniref:Nuclear cap-binding protein subunit 1 n=1 Tax=Clydaea vesicula TaxID=447962 RepID=A0AAD5TYH1_9FUNG|nr:Nuclear cap-binding protein subunit 1 [Clydaea vesicula]